MALSRLIYLLESSPLTYISKCMSFWPPKSPMSLTAPGTRGVVTDFTDATPSVTVAFQAVSAPANMVSMTSREIFTDND